MLRSLAPRLGKVDLRTARQEAKQADRFYLSPEWRSLRDDVLKRDGRTCCQCGRSERRMFVDHITEIRDGGARLDPANCQVLCGSCHTTKTAAERAKRMAARP